MGFFVPRRRFALVILTYLFLGVGCNRVALIGMSSPSGIFAVCHTISFLNFRLKFSSSF